MKKLLAIVFVCIPVFIFAQTRNDTTIHIPMPVGGNSTQQTFFKENFEMETVAAGYATTENASQADYTLKLEVQPNMIVYDDGTEEQAPPEEKQYVLELRLIRNEDGNEIVMFNFPFTEVEEMYEYNLYLLYQAMANVPLTKLTSVLETDHWRNKWVYVRGSLDYTISNYQADVADSANWKSEDGTSHESLTPEIARSTTPMVAGTLGVEFQFLNWMSAEGDIKLIFGDPEQPTFVPTVGAFLKFPLKPSKHFMLEPYLGIDFPMFTGAHIKNLSPFNTAIGGGFQFGVKGGEFGAFFVDVNFMYTLAQIKTETTNRAASWERWVLGFGIGYKIGFLNRNKEPNQ